MQAALITMFKFFILSLLISFYCHAEQIIKIGYITDLSGKAAFWGTQSSFGAEMAVKELKEAGNEIELIIGDSKLDTKTAITEAKQLLHLKKVDALMNDFTPTSIAASNVAKQAKKLYVYLAPAVSILETNPYAFKSFLDYEAGCKEVAKHWKKKGIKKVAKLKLNTEFGELCLSGAKAVYPDIFVADYNSGEDLRTLVLSFKQRGIQAFFQTAYEVDMLHRLKLMGELDYHVPVGGPEPLLTELVIKQEKENLKDTTVFGYPAISKEFIKKFKAVNPERTTTNIEAAALAYTHVYQIFHAINTCPKEDINCQVENMQLSPASKTIGFKGWNNRIADFDYTLKIWDEAKLQTLS